MIEVQLFQGEFEAIAECMSPQTYTKVCAFLGLVGHYRWFIKGFTCIAPLFNEHLAGEGASKRSEQISLSEDVLKAFKALKQVCMTAPILAFTDYTKLFLLETDLSKEGLAAVLSQKQADGWYHPIAYGSRALTPYKKSFTQLSLSFSVEVGSYRAFQGVPALSIFPAEDRQQSIDLHNDST